MQKVNVEKIQNNRQGLAKEKLGQTLKRISALPAVQLPPVCLPDMHMKDKTEAPCSLAVAAENMIIPELTAPSVGCGMGVIRTSLTRRDLTPEKLGAFYAYMQKYRGKRYGTLKNMLLWLGIISRPPARYDFSKEELAGVIRSGASAAAKKYGMPAEILEHVEYGGDVMDAEAERMFPPKRILPRAAWASGRHDIGYGFKGNHFLEVQYVETLHNEEEAARWGMAKDQIVIMYHGGGGAVSHYVGRYFAKRTKDSGSFKSRVFQWFAKFIFHFGDREGVRHMRERWRYYFHPHPFQEIPISSHEGKRLMASIKASLNYSYAFRLAIAKRVIDALHEIFGGIEASLLWDSAHNSIVQETIGIKRYIVHRHTATRVFDGKPVIISGYNTTNSYIGIGLPHAEEHLFSADHGAGETIKRSRQNGNAAPHPENHITEIHTTKPPYKENIPHITNEGLYAVTRPLEEAGVVSPVLLTRPIAVFKG